MTFCPAITGRLTPFRFEESSACAEPLPLDALRVITTLTATTSKA
jgi:hypothetical protein